MSPIHLESQPILALLYAMCIYGAMLLFSKLLLSSKIFSDSATPNSTRFGSIDGLRGILALGVLIHHSFAAYGYFTTGEWKYSSSPIMNQLGQTTVALFFMITGFLFAIKASVPTIKWPQLYLSRIARLGPLNTLVVLVVFVTVFVLTGGVLNESPLRIFREFFQWMTFGCFGLTDVNALPMTWTLIAGVNWSLKYEIFFYIFVVPVLYVSVKLTSIRTMFGLTLATFGLLFAYRWATGIAAGNTQYMAHFLGGILVAYAVQFAAFRRAFATPVFKCIATLATCYLLTVTYANGNTAIICTVAIFAAIVGGASIFGILNSKEAMWLGDISYGVYLIHGYLLWLTLSSMKRQLNLSEVHLLTYLSIVIAVAVVVVLLASLSYAYLEKPIMTHARLPRKLDSNRALVSDQPTCQITYRDHTLRCPQHARAQEIRFSERDSIVSSKTD